MPKIESVKTAERIADAVHRYVEGIVLAEVTDAQRQARLRTVLRDSKGQLRTDLINAFRFGGFE